MFNRKKLPSSAPYPEQVNPWDSIPMGVGANKKVVTWDVEVAPHALIAGRPGGGKSVAQRCVLAHCINNSDEWQSWGIDLKRVELAEYSHHNGVVDIATDIETSISILRSIHNEINKRYKHMQNEGVSSFRDLKDAPKAMMLIIDEVSPLLSVMGKNSEDTREEAERLLIHIVRLGRAAGAHVLVGTQLPEDIHGELSANIAFRYVTGSSTPHVSHVVLKSDSAVTTPLINGRGVVSVYGKEKNIQGFYLHNIPKSELNAVPIV